MRTIKVSLISSHIKDEKQSTPKSTFMNPDVYFERGRFIIKRAGTSAFQTGFHKKKKGQELQVVSFSESGFFFLFSLRTLLVLCFLRGFFCTHN